MDTAKTEMLTFCLKNCVKGDQTKDTSWSENAESVQLFPYACFVWWFCQYLNKRSSLLSQVSALWGAAVFGRSLPVNSKERLSCEIFDTFFIQHMPALTYASKSLCH